MEKPSFGKPLEEHLAVSGREIAFPVEACVTMLLECGMQEEVGAVGTAWLHPVQGDEWPGEIWGFSPGTDAVPCAVPRACSVWLPLPPS